jgi:hypothetical protein
MMHVGFVGNFGVGPPFTAAVIERPAGLCLGTPLRGVAERIGVVLRR